MSIITLTVAMISYHVTNSFDVAMFGIIVWGFFMTAIITIPTMIDFDTDSPVKQSEFEIVVLKDNTNTEGQFFLGSGNISGVDYYYYMLESEKGFSTHKVPTEFSYVKEVDNDNYRLETYALEVKSPFVKWFYGFFLEPDKEYIFHIPKDSITKEFKVDME